MDGQVYKSSDAVENIKNIIEAMATAKNAQTDLQKQVMLKQIGDKMDLTQKGKEQIQEKNINYGYTPGGDNSNIAQTGIATPPTAPTGGTPAGLSPTSGVATGATPGAQGGQPILQGQPSPMASLVNPTAPQAPVPQTPPMTMANPAQQPANTAASQLTMPQVSQPVGQPQPPSVQYTNLGYKPVEAAAIVQARKTAGQPINMADRAYVMALQKVKAGTASAGELDMVNKMNNRDAQNNPIIPNTKPQDVKVGNDPNPGLVQSDPALAILEKRYNYPPGSLTRDFETGNPVLNPFVKSRIEKEQAAQAALEVNRPFREEGRQQQMQNEVINRISNVRGDTSIKNIETQRDSTILAYKTLQDCKNMGRLPTQFEYQDILGQIWKARTGAAPTNEVMSSLNTPNIEQNMRKLYTAVTGDSSSGTSTPQIVNALTNFVQKTGLQLDKMHDNYFQDHLIKPPGMDQADFDSIVSRAKRGESFKEAMDDNGKSSGNADITLPAGIKTTSQAVDYLMTAQKMSKQDAIDWIRSQNGS